MKVKNLEDLKKHIGHNIVCRRWDNTHISALLDRIIAVELYCEDCKETLLLFKKK